MSLLKTVLVYMTMVAAVTTADILSSCTAAMTIPTDRPPVALPNLCSEKCDPYFEKCVTNKCSAYDTISESAILQVLADCRKDTCIKAQGLAACGNFCGYTAPSCPTLDVIISGNEAAVNASEPSSTDYTFKTMAAASQL